MDNTIRFITFNFFRITVLSFVFLHSISCKKEESNSYQLDRKSVVHISFINLTDSLKINLYNLPIIKSSYFNEVAIINKGVPEKKFTVPCEYPQAVQFSIGNRLFTGFVSPNDTLKIIVRLKKQNDVDSLYFKGKTQAFCNYYYEKQICLGYPDLRIPLNKVASNADLILLHTDSLMANELAFLKKYQQKSNLPDWFIRTEKCQIVYLCNNFKLSQEALYTKILKKPFNPGQYYYKSIDTLLIDNPNGIFSYWYFDFLKSYLVYRNIKTEGLNTKDWMDQSTKAALTIAYKQLTGEQRDIFEYNFLSSYLNWTKNLADYDQIFAEHRYDLSNLYFLNNLLEKRSVLTDSVVRNRNDNFSNSSNTKLKSNAPVPYFYLPDINGKFISLKDFKDKIIYVSFWATWCKPCIASIPEKNELIRKYSGNKKIVFINICISSQTKNWEKLVNTSSLQGINLFANENWSQIISQKYGISGVPAYFLIGNDIILKPYCDGPSNIEDDLEHALQTTKSTIGNY